MCDSILTLTKTSTVKICKPYKCSKTLSSIVYDFCQCNGTPCASKRILVTLSAPKSLCEFKIDTDNDPTTKIIKLDKMNCLHITSMIQYGDSIIGVDSYGFDIYICDKNNSTKQLYARNNSNLECSVINLLNDKGICTDKHKLNITGLFMKGWILHFIVFQSKCTSRVMHIMSVPICYCGDSPKYDSQHLTLHSSYDIYKSSLCHNICEKRARNMTVMNITLGPQNDLYVLTSYGKGGYIWKIDYFPNLISYSVNLKLATSKINCKPRTISYVNNKIMVLTNPNKCGDDITMYTYEF